MSTRLALNLRGDDARQRFLDLVQRYRTAKAGRELREMKFRCGDISIMYHQHIAGRMADLYPSDDQAREDAQRAFFGLGSPTTTWLR